MRTNASNTGVCCSMSNRTQSRTCNSLLSEVSNQQQRKYTTTEKEVFGVLLSTEIFRLHIDKITFEITTFVDEKYEKSSFSPM